MANGLCNLATSPRRSTVIAMISALAPSGYWQKTDRESSTQSCHQALAYMPRGLKSRTGRVSGTSRGSRTIPARAQEPSMRPCFPEALRLSPLSQS
jgi:hypothetical protein